MHQDRSDPTHDPREDELPETIADRFEEAWRRGVPPEIEPFLPGADSPHRSSTLAALVRIDVSHRRRAGDDAQVEDYLERYPELTLAVEGHVLAAGERPSGIPTDAGPPPSACITEGIPRGEEVTRPYPSATWVDGVAPTSGDAATGSPGTEVVDASGRYSLVSLHAEGGIGQVWMARDNDLGREVAVKRLRPEAAGGAAAQARFLREARVTGLLQHPGIVPVYELRRSEGGGAFYAMRFIRGRTLTQAARDYHRRREAGDARELELRELLGSYVNACLTVAYAHSRGVIHRDLKGQNVVLGDYGEVMVVDWGLAKVVGEAEPVPVGAIEAAGTPTPGRADDAPSTRTIEGEVLGTPSTMAPEQAQGRTDLIEPRTDIYGLGAILYQILTGEPPFGGSVEEVLRKVVNEPPVPPRRRVAGTPPALEAICMKCLAKAPSDRYGSANELAEEIRRYLADEPVTAFAEPWTTRLRRWVDRHRTTATASGAALLVATASLAAATVFLGRANDRETRAHAQAERNFRLAREAVDRYFNKISDDRRLKALGLEKLRQDLLVEAREFYEKFAREKGGEPRADADRGWSNLRLARITEELGQFREAALLSQQARSIFEGLSRRWPRDPEYREGLARSLESLGAAYGGDRQLDEAREALEGAVSAWDRLARDHRDQPAFRFRMAVALDRLGKLLCIWTRDTAGGESALQRGLSLCGELVREHPGVPEYRNEQAEAMLQLGHSRSDREFEEARSLLEEALRIRQELADEHPGDLDCQASLVDACTFIVSSYSNARKLDRVRSIYEKIRGISARLARDHPDVPLFVEDHLLIEIVSGLPMALAGDHAGAAAVAEEAIARAPRSGLVKIYAACGYCVASEAAAEDEKLPAAGREQVATRYLGRAIDLLRGAKELGLFRQPRYAAALETDPDLAALRRRPDFPGLLAELKADQAANP
jgi:serine/threonine protein kinase/tetratricopeptide (TPR) repeat protein